MEINEELYQSLIEVRDKIKEKARKKNKVFNCSDAVVMEIAKFQPVKISDFAGISGVGPVFIENYAQYFIEVVKDFKDDSGTSVRLNKKGVTLLQDFEKKLVNLNKRNHLLYCAKLYNRFGIDLFGAQNDVRNILLGTCHAATIAKAGDKNYTPIVSLIRSNNRNLREKGQNNLFIGYPFVRGNFPSEDFSIRAPLALFPIKEEKTANGIKVAVDNNREVLFNTTLILANFKFNNINKPLPDGEIEDRSKEGFIQSLVDFYKENKLNITIPEGETDELKAFENYTAENFPKMKKGEFVLENSAVLGIFPICSSSIQKDFQAIAESRKINKLLNDLLGNKDSDSLEDNLFENDLDENDDSGDISEKEICYINNLDAAQENVIATLHKSDELVVQGPPGTGKSQTITSLIADFVSRDKSVLLVSEKKTALDVVYSRLGNLSKYALILDDVNDKDAFYSQLSNMVAPVKLKEVSAEGLEALETEIDEKVGYLNKLGDIFYKPDEFGIEPYKLYLLNKPEELLKKENLKKLRRISDALGEEYKEYNYFDSIEGKNFYRKDENLENLNRYFSLLTDNYWLPKTKGNLTAFEIQSMDLDYDKILEDAAKRNELKFFKKIFSKNEVKADLREFFSRYFDFSCEARESEVPFAKLIGSSKEINKKIGKSVRKLNGKQLNGKQFNGKKAKTQEKILLNAFAKKPETLESLSEVYEEFWELERFYSGLSEKVQNYYFTMKKIMPLFANNASDEKELIHLTNEEFAKYLPAKHLMELESRFRDDIPTLDHFEEVLKQIDADMEAKRKMEKSQLEKVLAERASVLSNSKRKSEILKALESKRKWSVNKFFNKYNFEIFNSIKIWLLTPEVVSEILPLETGLFDLVVFDEASQMYVEKGIPSILRGNKIVVAGDQKQLRPSSLGTGRFTLEEDDLPEDEELSAAQDEDSLLDLARFKYNRTMLNFHYRSNYEELIAFSNYAFYDGKLYVSPNISTPDLPPIEVHKMENALWVKRTNEVEAKYIVELLKKFFAERKKEETVGIITFNSNQRDKIDDLIDKECEKDPEFAALIDAEMQRKKDGEDIGLFVKNIETVQGDERDVIIFSMGYGLNEEGKFIQNFGWLNQSGGENRLNVAISRAKKKVHIVVSFDPSEIKEGKAKNGGPLILKKYLEYAFAVSDRDSERAKACLESLLSPAEQEILAKEKIQEMTAETKTGKVPEKAETNAEVENVQQDVSAEESSEVTAEETVNVINESVPDEISEEKVDASEVEEGLELESEEEADTDSEDSDDEDTIVENSDDDSDETVVAETDVTVVAEDVENPANVSEKPCEIEDITAEKELELAQNTFEDEVYNALVAKGYEVERHIGIAGYTIDFAVKKNKRYVLGIECDSRLYEISTSARERDYYRQKYLESRGWKIFRVWSIVWKKNPEKVIAKIEKMLEKK